MNCRQQEGGILAVTHILNFPRDGEYEPKQRQLAKRWLQLCVRVESIGSVIDRGDQENLLDFREASDHYFISLSYPAWFGDTLSELL
jgi:hypothetical protein